MLSCPAYRVLHFVYNVYFSFLIPPFISTGCLSSRLTRRFSSRGFQSADVVRFGGHNMLCPHSNPRILGSSTPLVCIKQKTPPRSFFKRAHRRRRDLDGEQADLSQIHRPLVADTQKEYRAYSVVRCEMTSFSLNVKRLRGSQNPEC